MSTPCHVVILGGGVIGLSTAFFLAMEGAKVTLLERSEIGRESSWAGAGIVPYSAFDKATCPLDQLRALSCELFPVFTQNLFHITRIDNEYVVCGGLDVSDTVPMPSEWHNDSEPIHRLDADALRTAEPTLNPAISSAYKIPSLAQLRNPRHLAALHKACKITKKVDLIEHVGDTEWEIQDARITAVRTNMGTYAGDKFLIAAGAWSGELLKPLGHAIPISPVRGEIVLFRPERRLLNHVILRDSQYLVPRHDGHVLAGSTEADVGFDKRPSEQGIAELTRLAVDLVPELANAPIERTWAGLRPGSADGLPYLGGVPGFENLWIGAGHFRAGIQLSLGTALVLKQSLLEQPLAMSLDAFNLDRPPLKHPT